MLNDSRPLLVGWRPRRKQHPIFVFLLFRLGDVAMLKLLTLDFVSDPLKFPLYLILLLPFVCGSSLILASFFEAGLDLDVVASYLQLLATSRLTSLFFLFLCFIFHIIIAIYALVGLSSALLGDGSV